MNNKKLNDIERLTELDDRTVEEISEAYPFLDSSSKARIKALCERKMSMNTSNNKNENTNENEIVYGHI